MNTKADVYLEFANSEASGLGLPPPKGRMGSAFDVVGERREVAFNIGMNAERMEETIEIKVHNHEIEPVDVLVRDVLYRWTNNDIVESTHRYEREDARTVHFPVTIPADGEAVLRYRVRYTW